MLAVLHAGARIQQHGVSIGFTSRGGSGVLEKMCFSVVLMRKSPKSVVFLFCHYRSRAVQLLKYFPDISEVIGKQMLLYFN